MQRVCSHLSTVSFRRIFPSSHKTLSNILGLFTFFYNASAHSNTHSSKGTNVVVPPPCTCHAYAAVKLLSCDAWRRSSTYPIRSLSRRSDFAMQLSGSLLFPNLNYFQILHWLKSFPRHVLLRDRYPSFPLESDSSVFLRRKVSYVQPAAD